MKKYKVTVKLKKPTGTEIKEVEFGGRTNGEAIAEAFEIAWSFQDVADVEEREIIKVEETDKSA